MRPRNHPLLALAVVFFVGPTICVWWACKFLALSLYWLARGTAWVIAAGIEEIGTYRRVLAARREATSSAPAAPYDPRAHQSNRDWRLAQLQARWNAEDNARTRPQAYYSSRR